MIKKKMEEIQKRRLKFRPITQSLKIENRTNEKTITKIIVEEMMEKSKIRSLTIDKK